MQGILEKNYLSHAEQTNSVPRGEGHVAWECPANIAVIKYWGKKPVQLPVNPSLSFTLSKSITRLSVDYAIDPGYSFDLDFRFDGKSLPVFREKIVAYLQKIVDYFPFLKNAHLDSQHLEFISAFRRYCFIGIIIRGAGSGTLQYGTAASGCREQRYRFLPKSLFYGPAWIRKCMPFGIRWCGIMGMHGQGSRIIRRDCYSGFNTHSSTV